MSTCPHFDIIRNEEILKSYRVLVRLAQIQSSYDHHVVGNEDIVAATCSACDEDGSDTGHHIHDRRPMLCLYACLQCLYIGCHDASNSLSGSHRNAHSEQRNHHIFIDLDYKAQPFCVKCNDYFYDWQLLQMYRLERLRIQCNDLDVHDQHLSLKPLQSVAHNDHQGLRGLRNLGSTCFMNVVIQVLVHNVFVRRWFLADFHNRRVCFAQLKGVNHSSCTACQLDQIIANFNMRSSQMKTCNSGDLIDNPGSNAPFVPSGFLYSTWTNQWLQQVAGGLSQSPQQGSLIGYSQQDAHEFFISLLNILHNDQQRYLKRLRPSSTLQLTNISVDQAFSGQLQSTIECSQCGHKSETTDPFMDISLDVRPVFSPAVQALGQQSDVKAQSMKVARPKGAFIEHKIAIDAALPMSVDTESGKQKQKNAAQTLSNVQSPVESHSLHECLDRFTSKEDLAHIDYKCSKCSQKAGVTKQLRFAKLPNTLVFHLKRYNSSYTMGASQVAKANTLFQYEQYDKLNMLIQFPSEINMFQYTKLAQSVDSLPTKYQEHFSYILYAVIVHHGTLNSGHYIVYVRHLTSTVEQWFRIDDSLVHAVDWNEIASCQAYMLFYSKKDFDYSDK
ncbi:hypothetical protein MP228_001031 [Amoeboaphelidium protococcarum]|nr:hypothetical protein MP228_001031 [Amoeboaphelidium protococcarum]